MGQRGLLARVIEVGCALKLRLGWTAGGRGYKGPGCLSPGLGRGLCRDKTVVCKFG